MRGNRASHRSRRGARRPLDAAWHLREIQRAGECHVAVPKRDLLRCGLLTPTHSALSNDQADEEKGTHRAASPARRHPQRGVLQDAGPAILPRAGGRGPPRPLVRRCRRLRTDMAPGMNLLVIQNTSNGRTCAWNACAITAGSLSTSRCASASVAPVPKSSPRCPSSRRPCRRRGARARRSIAWTNTQYARRGPCSPQSHPATCPSPSTSGRGPSGCQGARRNPTRGPSRPCRRTPVWEIGAVCAPTNSDVIALLATNPAMRANLPPMPAP